MYLLVHSACAHAHLIGQLTLTRLNSSKYPYSRKRICIIYGKAKRIQLECRSFLKVIADHGTRDRGTNIVTVGNYDVELVRWGLAHAPSNFLIRTVST